MTYDDDRILEKKILKILDEKKVVEELEGKYKETVNEIRESQDPATRFFKSRSDVFK